MILRPPISTRTDTLLPSTTRFRSDAGLGLAHDLYAGFVFQLWHVLEGHRHDDIHLAANQGRDACRPLCNGLEQYLGNIAGYALVPVALVTFERSLDLGLTLDDLEGVGAILMKIGRATV